MQATRSKAKVGGTNWVTLKKQSGQEKNYVRPAQKTRD